MEATHTLGYRDLTPALDELPLFPLPTVLFPGALLPLHVFEPRYRAMVHDVLKAHRVIGIVLFSESLAPGARPSDLPTIASVATAASILDVVELPSGSFNIILRGRARVSLEELPFVRPYRRARATILTPPLGEVHELELASMLAAASSFATKVRERDPSFELNFPPDVSPGTLADLAANHLVLEAEERQEILETLDPAARVRRVTEVLSLQRLSLSPLEPAKAN